MISDFFANKNQNIVTCLPDIYVPSGDRPEHLKALAYRTCTRHSRVGHIISYYGHISVPSLIA